MGAERYETRGVAIIDGDYLAGARDLEGEQVARSRDHEARVIRDPDRDE